MFQAYKDNVNYKGYAVVDINNEVICEDVMQKTLAERFDCSVSTIRSYVKSGKVFKDFYYIVEMEDLDNFIAERSNIYGTFRNNK